MVIFFRLRPDPLTLAGLKCVLVRVAPTGAEEPTMDLRKLPLGIEVADPEAQIEEGKDHKFHAFHFDAAGSSFQV